MSYYGKKYFEENIRLKNQIGRLRSQMIMERRIWSEEHDIDDEKRRNEAIWYINIYWQAKREFGKINIQNQSEVLGEKWEENFNNKQGKDILKEQKRIIKLIDNANSKK